MEGPHDLEVEVEVEGDGQKHAPRRAAGLAWVAWTGRSMR
jgi:hypothetical protein